MAQIVFLVLAHERPKTLERMLKAIEGAGAFAMVHFDARGGDISGLKNTFRNNSKIAFTSKRIRCHWGHWSLLRASMHLAQEGLRKFSSATHFYLISGSCAPIMPLAQIERTLNEESRDYIECADFSQDNWVKSGDQIARAAHFHLFPERWSKWLFTWHKDIQYHFGMYRDPPADMPLRIGSQWWCLRRESLQKTLEVLDTPQMRGFFKWVWIPDEIGFQSALASVVPAEEISGQSPTLSAFSVHGQPFEFFDDHAALLAQSDQFFARKISSLAPQLFDDLWHGFSAPAGPPRHISGAAYLALHQNDLSLWQDKVLPFWSDTAVPARQLQLFILIVQDEDHGLALADSVAHALTCPSLGYPWSNRRYEAADLGDWRHDAQKRRKFWSEVLDRSANALGTSRMVLCINRGDLQMLHAICRRYDHVRVLPLRRAEDEAHLLGERGVRKGGRNGGEALAQSTLELYDTALAALPIPWLFDPKIHGWPAAWAGFCANPSIEMPQELLEFIQHSGENA